MVAELRKKIRSELEASPETKQFGTGWISGVSALVLATAGLALVFCLRYPSLFTVSDARPVYSGAAFRLGLHFLLITSFLFSILNLVLRKNKVLGFTGMTITLLATLLGGSRVEPSGELTTGMFLGLDWFVLNVILTGFLFIPFETFFPRSEKQPIFRIEWREDLLQAFRGWS